ncbi:MAG TPA: hypothetical protein VF329_15020 [Gammaproteobacteria bacterium]
MKVGSFRAFVVAGALAATLPALAQTGHPAKGSWIGYWGPSEAEGKRMLLVLDWENREIVGTINPGRNGVPIDSAEIDYSTWTMTLEAQMPTEDGGTETWVATGKLENLGSWTNRRYVGTYRLGDETGRFALIMN